MPRILLPFLCLFFFAPAFAGASLSPAERDSRIYDYFRRANENVGALSCNQTIHERDVPASTKRLVKARDGRRCVICRSTVKLEVDHIRALQNGGSNAVANLATLCDDCHTIKTRLDNSLRRKRDRICRTSVQQLFGKILCKNEIGNKTSEK